MYSQTLFTFCEFITVSILAASIAVFSHRLFSKLAIFIVTRPWRRYRTFTFRSSQWINHSYPLYCVVCLQEAEEGDKMRRLTICGHCFHADCIDPWLGEISSTCPLCRAEVPPSPPVNPLLLLFVSANKEL
ncbi:RING/U-box superfamily protein [Raphanus sativus]|nr:RING/U-box superfamily protein [Raphanus sativus]